MKIQENYLEIGPAYGRDYKNGKLAKADFNAGKDFKMLSMTVGGTYCSKADFAEGVVVNIRFNSMQGLTSEKVKH